MVESFLYVPNLLYCQCNVETTEWLYLVAECVFVFS